MIIHTDSTYLPLLKPFLSNFLGKTQIYFGLSFLFGKKNMRSDLKVLILYRIILNAKCKIEDARRKLISHLISIISIKQFS